MKKIFLIHILLILTLLESCGQSVVPPYRQLSSFGDDTLTYLKYNFQERKSYYSDKSMETFLNDLEIPVKSIIPTSSSSKNDDICEGLIISFEDNSNTVLKTYFHSKIYYLNIDFKSIISLREVYNTIQTLGSNNWSPTLNDYFKGVIISDILAYALPDPTQTAALCDPTSPRYCPLYCIDNSVVAYYDFTELPDQSTYGNHSSLQDEAILTDGTLVLSGGSPWDYMHPHATVANSPSLNPQYITVAARLKPQDFYGCGNDAIVNKPFTSHTAPYYQYHLGICGTYCGGGGYYFSFCCSINGVSQGMYSTPNVWVPDQWYTVIGTYDGSILKLFVNGALVASKAVTGTIDSFDTDVFIGKHGNVDYSIPAEIDWVKVYNRALTDTEVAALGQ